MRIATSRWRRHQVEAHILALLGTVVCYVGELGAIVLLFWAIQEHRPTHAVVYAIALLVLVLTDHLVFPFPRSTDVVDERRRMDAAARFGSSRIR